jgi:predicted PurR-regulated permease PerM
MERTSIEPLRHPGTEGRGPWSANFNPRWLPGTLIIVLAAWVLHSFVQAGLAACVTAIASWPLYRLFASRLPRRLGRSASALLFTCLMTVFVLAPMMFAFGALLTEARTLLLEIATADKLGIAAPPWLDSLPVVGPWVASRWQSEFAHPGALLVWTQRTDPTALLGWAQSLGQFMARHTLIVGFAILLLFFLYQEGESLAEEFNRALCHRFGQRAEAYVAVATRAVRASVNSVLVVGLFDGLATGVAFAIAGVPHPAVWGAIIGAVALVPFLGYAAVVVLTVRLAITGAVVPALLSLGLGFAVLFCGDKIVRPLVARDGIRLRFVWILMACLGGFEAFGLMGLVIGPVVLTLARELWRQCAHDLALPYATDSKSRSDPSA